MVIININFADLESLMVYAKFQDHEHFGSIEEFQMKYMGVEAILVI